MSSALPTTKSPFLARLRSSGLVVPLGSTSRRTLAAAAARRRPCSRSSTAKEGGQPASLRCRCCGTYRHTGGDEPRSRAPRGNVSVLCSFPRAPWECRPTAPRCPFRHSAPNRDSHGARGNQKPPGSGRPAAAASPTGGYGPEVHHPVHQSMHTSSKPVRPA